MEGVPHWFTGSIVNLYIWAFKVKMFDNTTSIMSVVKSSITPFTPMTQYNALKHIRQRGALG